MKQEPGCVLRGFMVVGLCLAVHIWAGSYEAAAQGEITVNCDAQETLAAALDQAAPGTTILINGTCMERVVVITDRITLDGQGGAIVDGGGASPGPVSEGVITIESAQGVVLTGLTVQNGPDGILGRRGASFAVSNTTVQDNADDGIQVDENSTARLTDCTTQRNGDDGIGVFRSSNATLNGIISSNENGDHGLSVALSASTVLNAGTAINVNNNGDTGIIISDASSLLASHTTDRVATITANGNLDDGVVATVSAGILLFGTVVEANNNGSDGISIRLNSSMAAEVGAMISTIQNGDDGIDVFGSSHFNTFRNVMITTRENADESFVAFGNANVSIGDPAGSTSTLLIENNLDDGFRVTNSSQAFVGSNTTLTIEGSGSSGIEVADSSHIDVLGTTLVSNSGSSGVVVVDVSDADLFGNVQILNSTNSGLVITQNSNIDGQDLTIMNNGRTGIFADFSSLDINRSTITQNTLGDIVLVLGTRADLTEITFGSFTCDASVLLTGDTGVTCPAAPMSTSRY